MSQVKKILVIRLSSFGDIVLSFPFLNLLRKNFPDSEIHFLTLKSYEEVVLLNPNIDSVITLEESLSVSRQLVKKENYDLIIDIHKNFKSIYLSMWNAKQVKRYKKENIKKFLIVNFKIDLFGAIVPVYQKYIKAMKSFLSEDDYRFTVTKLNFSIEKKIAGKYIVISPSSRHFTKTYPAEKFVNAINEFNSSALQNKEEIIKLVLVGDKSERDMKICELIETGCKNIINLCGKLEIPELAGILYNSEFVICNDSAILHFSEALGKRAVALFGSTVKEFGFFPQLKNSKVLEVNNLKCRPCTHIGRGSCPLGHFKCMEEIELSITNYQ